MISGKLGKNITISILNIELNGIGRVWRQQKPVLGLWAFIDVEMVVKGRDKLKLVKLQLCLGWLLNVGSILGYWSEFSHGFNLFYCI